MLALFVVVASGFDLVRILHGFDARSTA